MPSSRQPQNVAPEDHSASASEHEQPTNTNTPLPRSSSFGLNPFSAPPSVLSFSSDSPAHTPALHAGPHGGSGYFSSESNGGGSGAATPAGGPSRPTTGVRSSASSMYQHGDSTPRLREAFAPPPSRPVTISSSPIVNKGMGKTRAKSTMLEDPSKLEKPWLDKKDKAPRIAYITTYAVMMLGVAGSVIKGYFDWKTTPVLSGNLCPVLDEDFSGSSDVFGDNGLFMREVDMSGFGNGEFEMTTDSSDNSYIYDGKLYITPTLTSDAIGQDAVLDGHVYNITGCTFNVTHGTSYTSHIDAGAEVNSASDDFDASAYYKACSAVSNATTGQIIPPVRTARLRTRTASIRYGKVEVVAKIPKGDWIWPAIWMLPVDNAYGEWPRSGEIDIMEARGNDESYSKQGINYVRGSLNWGPLSWLNAVYKTYGYWYMRRGSYAETFHTYSLEWTEDFIRIYVDSRLHHLMEMKIKNSFWNYGDFPAVVQNGTDSIALTNPWVNGTNAAPFDQKFYLILSMAVGGTNGWFPDGAGDKPWLDNSATAARDFLNAQSKWYPTWSDNAEQRSLVIDSVKMWELC